MLKSWGAARKLFRDAVSSVAGEKPPAEAPAFHDERRGGGSAGARRGHRRDEVVFYDDARRRSERDRY